MNIKIKVSPNEIEVELPLVDIPILESVVESVVRICDGSRQKDPGGEAK